VGWGGRVEVGDFCANGEDGLGVTEISIYCIWR